MSAIKINFIGKDVALEKYGRLKKYLIWLYCVIWLVSLFFMILHYHKNQVIKQVYYNEIKKLNFKIDKMLPQFQTAIQLYEKRMALQQKLSKLFSSACEITFVRQCLENLAYTMPQNVWLKAIQFSALEKNESHKNTNASATPKSSMVIQGNLLMDFENKDANPIQHFQETLQKYKPYSFAQGRLDLSSMKVKKMEDKYYHNFVIEFAWSNFF